MALTDTALKALKPRDKPYTLADESGLYVEVFPTGGIVWRFRSRLNGKQERLTLGKYAHVYDHYLGAGLTAFQAASRQNNKNAEGGW